MDTDICIPTFKAWAIKLGILSKPPEPDPEPPFSPPTSAMLVTGQNDFGIQAVERLMVINRGHNGKEEYSFATVVHMGDRFKSLNLDLTLEQHEFLVKELATKLDGVFVPAEQEGL